MRLRGPRSLAAVIAGLVAIALFTACSSSAKPSAAAQPTTPAGSATSAATPATTTTNPPAPAKTPSACHPAPGFSPGTTTHRMTVAGEARELLVHMPPHPSPAMALVVDFHGAGSDMQQQDIYSGFDPLADTDGFVVATPNGIDAAIRQWRFLGKPNDVPFAVAIVKMLVRDACIDPAHAYAVGISSGSAMSTALACEASDTFSGFGLVAGDFYLPPICANARQHPIIIFHGTADPIVPYGGGQVANSKGLPVGSEEATAAAWAKHNGCRPGAVATQLGTQVVRLSWNGCAVPVVLYRIVGGGHTWPGAAIPVARLGFTTEQVSATREMWKLFSTQSAGN